jgi:FkbM family methyltransferase
MHKVIYKLNKFKGYEIRRMAISRIVSCLKAQDIDFIFDVGANTGQFACDLISNKYEGSILSIEPQSAAQAILRKRSEKYPNWFVMDPVALGAENATGELNISLNSVSSSLLPVSKQSIDVSPGTNFVGSEIVSIIKFDDVFEEYRKSGIKFAIKIDSQGYEMEILKGCKNSIEHVDVLILELSLTEVYVGGADYLKIIELLDSYGFILWDIHPGFKDRRTGQLLQFDGVFTRKTGNVQFKNF